MDILGTVLAGIAQHQVWFFAALLLVVLFIIVVMTVILVRAGRQPAEPPPEVKALPAPDAGDPAAAPGTSGVSAALPVVGARDIRRLFREGLAAYRETLSRNVYLVPWYLRTGVVPGDDGGLLTCAEEVRPPVESRDRPFGFHWRFYDRAVVIDIDDARVAWKGVLDQLARHRVMMPADGVILTIPLEELDDVRRAAARGTELYARLWEIQRTLGLALPVYVVITGCDAIPGFPLLAETLPEPLRDGMLGWSSPYALETVFNPNLVGEALQSVAAGMLALQLEVFGAAPQEDGAQLVALTDRLTGTEAALRAMLGTAFKRTAYQETLYVRGLYFVGRTAPETPAVFGRDLLNRKIFPEAGLPKPTRALAATRALRRHVWPVATATAAAAAILILWMGVHRVNTLSDQLVPILSDIPANLQQLSDQRAAIQAGAPLPPTYADAAARFVQGMATLPQDLPFIPLPAAWISGVPDEVARALAVGYRRLTLATMRDVAEDRLRRLTRDPPRVQIGASEFDRLRAFAADIGIAEGFAKAYNSVDSRDPNVPLDDALEFALGSGGARGFSDRLHGWGVDVPPSGGAIPAPGPSTQRPIDVSAYRADVTRRFRQFADAYLRELAMSGLAVARLSVAASELELLAGGARTGADAATSYAEVLGSLDEAARGLNVERGAWIGTDGPVLPPDFDALLAGLEKSELFGPTLRADIMELAQRRYDEAGSGGKSLDSVIGRLLVQGPNGAVRLSPAAESLRQTLAVWTARRFMRSGEASGTAATPAARTGWDRAALETIPPLLEDYLLFDAKEVPQVPQILRPSMRAAAQHQLRRGVEQILARALAGTPAGGSVDRAGGLTQLRESARSLRLAFPVLAETMQSFRQIGLATPADAIRDIVARQANAVLAQADRMLEEDQLYRPDARSLNAWIEGPLVPALLFGQQSPTALALYLGNARQEVMALTRDVAAPVVEILEKPVMGGAAGSGLSVKWGRIIAELDRYEGARPNSTLAALEKFVTTDVAAIDAASCRETVQLDGQAGDFFASRLNELKQSIADRCRLMVDQRVYMGYAELATAFNASLAGRFPFGPGGDSQADVAMVRAFYDAFEVRQGYVIEGLRRATRLGTAGHDALRFMETMALAKPALMAATVTDQTGGLLLDPTFRVNRGREAGGTNIIEWKLSTPAGSIANIGARSPLRWYPGDRVAVSLRWAKDGKLVPVAGVGASSAVDDTTLTFAYEGPWALFALVRQHNAAQRDRAAGTDTVLLFEAQTKLAPGSRDGDGKELADKARQDAPVPLTAAPLPGAPGAVAAPDAKRADTRVFMALGAKRTVVTDGKPPRDEKVALPDLPSSAPLLASAGAMPRPGFPGGGLGFPSAATGVPSVNPTDRAFFDLQAPPGVPPLLRPANQRVY
ncbi:type VI secretion system protein TssA [Azospirillum sp. 412522]|nr:type VI secretion protein IcmF/TssM N-terminal domain-containing protein [Azospirillum sp. 412522]MBY6262594.1 type VI secretion system protein TssA [Azospirillum sp. 412522]